MQRPAQASFPVAIALGSNLGNRRRFLRQAVHRMEAVVHVVRVSSIFETDPVEAPPDSPCFLNAVVAGVTTLAPVQLLAALQQIERQIGRRRGAFHSPRVIDLDLILYDACMVRSPALTIPHPRFREREFVLAPLRELGLNWRDPQTGVRIAELRGEGAVRRIGPMY
jgi:2-amino-4-hydroxy-6-hydroxymethyldihydropteridine diphosphokinase